MHHQAVPEFYRDALRDKGIDEAGRPKVAAAEARLVTRETMLALNAATVMLSVSTRARRSCPMPPTPPRSRAA
jgi:6-methylsalicylate decarboxylase